MSESVEEQPGLLVSLLGRGDKTKDGFGIEVVGQRVPSESAGRGLFFALVLPAETVFDALQSHPIQLFSVFVEA